MSPLRYTKVFGEPRSVVIMPEKLKGGFACLCCARPLSKWEFCFINRQAIGFIRSLLYAVTVNFWLVFTYYFKLLFASLTKSEKVLLGEANTFTLLDLQQMQKKYIIHTFMKKHSFKNIKIRRCWMNTFNIDWIKRVAKLNTLKDRNDGINHIQNLAIDIFD